MAAISIRNLSVHVGDAVLIDDITLDVPAGSWCTVIGPNGAGKTTLVESVAGIRSPSRGSIFVEDVDMSTVNERQRAKRIALVPQHPTVPAGMTVRDYVGLGRTAHHGILRAMTPRDRALVEDVLARLDLSLFAQRDVASLSGGERQRMVLARALAQSTMTIVLDEPISGLDLRHQIDFLELLRREVDDCGLTVLSTLHDLTLAGQYADRLVLLSDGSLVLEGLSRDVIRSPELAASYAMTLRVVDIDGADVVVPVRNLSMEALQEHPQRFGGTP
jgi:iron complex transport system ATP-binding protein